MENETTDKTVLLTGLDAAGLIDEVGPHSAETEGWQVSMVDDQTVLAVGFGRVKKGRRVASGRVAWIYWTRARSPYPRDGWYAHLAESDDHDADHRELLTFDDLVALLAWLRGGEPRTR